MPLSEKHYKEIAEIINVNTIAESIKGESGYTPQQEDAINETCRLIAYALAGYFEKENPLGYYKEGEGLQGFNREQFLKDCGVK